MARTNNLENFLTDVADAIKNKKGDQTDIPAANFDTEINNLPSQGTYQNKSVRITTNGTTTVTPDQNYDAMTEVEVTTQIPEKLLQTKNYEFTQNTNIELEPDTGYDGFDKVGLTINVSAEPMEPTTATADDLISPKTAYSNGQKITGTIEVQQTTLGPNMDRVDATVNTNLTVFDVNLTYEIALLAQSGGTEMYMYEYKDHELGELLDSITVSSIGGTGNFLNMQMALQTNSLSNLNVYAYTRVTDGAGYICAVQWEIANKQFSTTLKTAYSIAVPSDFYHVNQGCVAVNPVNCNVWALNNYARVAAGVPESGGYVGKYDPVNNTFTNVQSWGQGSTGAGYRPAKQLSAEWDSTGRYLYVVTNKAYGRWRMILYLNSTYTSYSTIYSAGNDNEYLCLWNGTYYFSDNNLKRLSDRSIVKTYDDLGMGNGTMYWTQQNTFFIVNFSLGTFTAYSINTSSLELIKIWQFNLTNTTVANMALAGAAVCPISNHLSLYAETPQAYFKEFYSTTFVQTNTAKMGISNLVNPIDATAKVGDILTGKTAYIKTGKQTGTMPNNGTLTYIPTDYTQTIPAGYTSGGTVQPMDITTSNAYKLALAQSQYLLVGNNPYIEVEYLEVTSGAPYINTGYRHKANTKVEIKFQASSSNTTSYVALMGARQNNYNNYSYNFFTRFNNASNFCYSRTGREITNSGFYNTPVTLTTYQNTATYTDGTTTRTISAGGTLNNGTNDFLLFNLNTGGAGAVAADSTNTTGNRIYYCKIWDDDGVTLMRDFIPAIRVVDNVIGMYDKVTDTLYEKLGNGVFIAGPNK